MRLSTGLLPTGTPSQQVGSIPTVKDALVRTAQRSSGLLTSGDLGRHAGRTAARAGLVLVQPRTFVAATQPLGVEGQVAAVRASVRGTYAFVDVTALWLHGVLRPPDVVRVGVPHGTRYRVHPPVELTRIAPHLLHGTRVLDGSCVVALEVALVQAATRLDQRAFRALLEDVLRRRLTTLPRLRARCGRGIAGSRALRAAVDALVGVSLDGAVRTLVAALNARGVTGLRVEVRFVNAAGGSAWADVLDDAGQTVLEVDGFLSHVERERFRADRKRDRWMHAEHELTTFRIDVAEITDDLPSLADEVASLLLVRRGSRIAGTGSAVSVPLLRSP